MVRQPRTPPGKEPGTLPSEEPAPTLENGTPETAPQADSDRTEQDPAEQDPLERLMRIVLDEQLLWPVAIAMLLVLATFGGVILIFSLKDRSLFGSAALLVLIFVTVYGLDADIRARRLQPRTWLILGLWLASAGAAAGLSYLGAM